MKLKFYYISHFLEIIIRNKVYKCLKLKMTIYNEVQDNPYWFCSVRVQKSFKLEDYSTHNGILLVHSNIDINRKLKNIYYWICSSVAPTAIDAINLLKNYLGDQLIEFNWNENEICLYQHGVCIQLNK